MTVDRDRISPLLLLLLPSHSPSFFSIVPPGLASTLLWFPTFVLEGGFTFVWGYLSSRSICEYSSLSCGVTHERSLASEYNTIPLWPSTTMSFDRRDVARSVADGKRGRGAGTHATRLAVRKDSVNALKTTTSPTGSTLTTGESHPDNTASAFPYSTGASRPGSSSPQPEPDFLLQQPRAQSHRQRRTRQQRARSWRSSSRSCLR